MADILPHCIHIFLCYLINAEYLFSVSISSQENNMKSSRTRSSNFIVYKQKPGMEDMSVLGKCEGERDKDKKPLMKHWTSYFRVRTNLKLYTNPSGPLFCVFKNIVSLTISFPTWTHSNTVTIWTHLCAKCLPSY
jgi:hypothetical protein